MILRNIDLRDLFYRSRTINNRFKVVYRSEWIPSYYSYKKEEQKVIFFDKIDLKYYLYIYERTLHIGDYKYQPISYGKENDKHYIMSISKKMYDTIISEKDGI